MSDRHEETLEFSLTGKARDREPGGILALGSRAANRRCAVGYLADFHGRGMAKARVWLGGHATRPTADELAPFEQTRAELRAVETEAQLAAMAW